ncbi:MAG: GntR family transcriptional regulator [Oscillochloris sp.]|nr:GntR family transcriptional regulator [Oscillochloris sp.]
MMIDKNSSVPFYLQLKRMIDIQVADGTLPPHSRIPSERELSEQFEISRMTARRALLELIREGRIYTRTGKGTFVAEPKISQNLQALTSFSEDMRARRMRPTARLLRRGMIAVEAEVARALRLTADAQVLCVERLRLADDAPMAVEQAHFSFPGMEALLDQPLDGSLYEILRDRFLLLPAEAMQEFEARLATPPEQELLRVGAGSPVLMIARTTFDQRGQPFEFVQSIYRADRYRFVARLLREDAR